ncbi:MAG: molybdopterin molybdenumtransferase MoeA [Phormidium sp. GEM2.Bin31]|nr:MAG: molybdopterin molybdenumtransferase MoeA [Phormidium sp. GEM2.Bin31]
MLSVADAERVILAAVAPLTEVEGVHLPDAMGRILAQAVSSQLDFPHWDNSAMDGYAVRFEDVADSSGDNPQALEVIEEIAAGQPPQNTLEPGQAARIFTGAMVPPGADTIVMQENTIREGDRLEVLEPPKALGEFVRHRGRFYQAGTPLLNPGIRLRAAEIAVLAAAQCNLIKVIRKPRVAILSTGSELVAPDQPLKPGQIVDSNQYALAAFLQQLGIEALRLGIVADDPQVLRQNIREALQWGDVVLSTGGVSVGDYDYIEGILQELGGELLVRSVAIKPGKPLTMARFTKLRSLYFGLPGNPVSALVTAWRFVQPALLKLSGLSQGWQPQFVEATTELALPAAPSRETYIWGQVTIRDGHFYFNCAGGSFSSGNLVNLAQTTACAVIPVGSSAISAGDKVSLLLLSA